MINFVLEREIMSDFTKLSIANDMEKRLKELIKEDRVKNLECFVVSKTRCIDGDREHAIRQISK